jgi:hypothetical protein
MKKKIPILVRSLIIFTVFLLFIFTIFNSFSKDYYIPVHKKWFIYGKVIPPVDYNKNDLRVIDIDLLAPKETANDGDFYWLQTSGDLITLTNRNFIPVKGILAFNLDVDPCGTERSIFVGTKQGSIQVQTLKSKQAKFEFEFMINSNSSEFLSIVGSPVSPCKINEEMARSFLAKLTDIEVVNLEVNE